jgi:hypothetical protein
MTSVVRLDNLQAIYGGGHIHSVQSAEVIQNGQVGVVGNLLTGEREVRSFDKPADLATAKASLVAQDEIMYDQVRKSQNNLKDFSIEAGTPFRTYDLAEGDVFSVSKDAIDALATDVVVGNKVVLQVGSHKLAENDGSALTTERFVGRIEAVEQIGTTSVVGAAGVVGGVIDFVVIRVEKN